MIKKILKFLKDTFVGRDVVSRKEFKKLEVVKRRWLIIPKLDMYIMREFLTKWSILILVFVFGFVMGDVFERLGDFIEANMPWTTTCMFFLLRLPGNIRFILPISMLLGTIWTMAAFGKNQEIIAMRASGVSLFRCSVSMIFIGFLVTLVNIYFNEMLVPYTDYRSAQIRAIVDRSGNSQKMLPYNSPDSSRRWFFSIFEENSFQNNVLFKQYTDDGKTLLYDLKIKKAEYKKSKGWTFYDVVKTQYVQGKLPDKTVNIDKIEFSEDEIDETPEDILNAIKDEEDLPSWVIWDILRNTENMSERLKDIYMTYFCYRLAFPWACFIAVFLGIPIATKNERSGVMLSIMTAVGMIIGYIVCAELFLLFGKSGVLNPVIAGFAPTVGFIAYGYYTVMRGGGY